MPVWLDQLADLTPRKVWGYLCRNRWLAFTLLMCGVGLRVFSEMAEQLHEGTLPPVDMAIQAAIRPYHTPTLDLLAHGLSAAVLWPYVLLLAGPFLLYLLLTRRRLHALGLLVIPLGTVAIVETLKLIFHRDRPLTALVAEWGNSFPSGHATGAIVLYGLLGYVAWRFWVRRRWARALVAVGAVVLTLATGLARVYLEVHYPSDVLAGWSAGLFLFFGSVLLLTRVEGEEGGGPSPPR